MAQEYVKVFPPESLNELVAWFKARRETLPATLELGPGLNIEDLGATVDRYFDIVALHRENPTYGAQILHLFRMRERLVELGY
ncbi:MAG: hypothetical protein HUK09_00345 [Bacteroidaceae bacterium]|nr:hypothetical protein [Bacteroidaceae bacterium]